MGLTWSVSETCSQLLPGESVPPGERMGERKRTIGLIRFLVDRRDRSPVVIKNCQAALLGRARAGGRAVLSRGRRRAP